MPQRAPEAGPKVQSAHPTAPEPTSGRALLLSFRTRRWRWPWAVLATLTGIVFAAALMLAAGFVVPGGTDVRGDDTPLLRPGNLNDYLIILAAWGMLAFAGLLALRLVKGDAMRRAFTATDAFHAGDFVKTALAITIMFALGYALTYLSTPEHFTRPERLQGFGWWIALGLAVILVQSSAEEIFFRGFLFRIWGAVIANPWIVAGAIMSVFIALHLPNPDVQRDVAMAMIAFVLGEALAYWALIRTKCLAAPMGLHFANNAFQFFLVGMEPMGDSDAAIFVYTDPVYAAGGSRLTDPASHLMTLAGYAMLIALLFWRRSPLYLPRRSVKVEVPATPLPPPPAIPQSPQPDAVA